MENVYKEGFYDEPLSVEERVKQPLLWEKVYKSREVTADLETWELYSIEDATKPTNWDINWLKSNLNKFFDWVNDNSDDNDFSEFWSSFRIALDNFQKGNYKEWIWRFFWWLLEMMTDKKKTHESFGDPSWKVDRSQYTKDDLFSFYTSQIVNGFTYKRNPRNLINYVSTCSSALDNAVQKEVNKPVSQETNYTTSIGYLIAIWSVQEWDTIVLNSPDLNLHMQFITMWIQWYDALPYTHTAIITWIDKNNPDDFEVIHSTGWTWVVKDTWKNITKWWRTDYMVMDTPQDEQLWVVEFCKSKEWSEYDQKWVAADTYSGQRNFLWKDDDFYCSELYLNALEHAWTTIDSSLFSPWDILQVVPPLYLWTT
jgi:hypothetical protein